MVRAERGGGDHRLADLVDGLEPLQREVAQLVYLDGLSFAEVAGRLGIGRSDVSATLSAAFTHIARSTVAAPSGSVASPSGRDQRR